MEIFVGQSIIRVESAIYFAADMSKILFGTIYSGQGDSTPGMAIEWKPGKESPFGHFAELDHEEVRQFATRNHIPIEEGAAIPWT